MSSLRGITALLTLCLASCVSYTTTPGATSPEGRLAPIPASTELIFDYEKSEIPYKNRVLEEEETALYRVRYVRFPSIGENGQPENLVTGLYYESKLPGPRPVMVILPIWGAAEYPSKVMTALFKEKSRGEFHVFQMLGESFILDWEGLYSAKDEGEFLETWRSSAEREWATIVDIRRTIDWAEGRAEVDASRIGLIGFSHGAMLAAAALVHEPRLAATALIMGGGYPHHLVGRCPSRRCSQVRTKAREDYGWTSERLENELEPIFRSLDAVHYPGRVDPTRVLIVEATNDSCMSEPGRQAMWEALNRPERIQLNSGHARAFLALTPFKRNWLRHRIWDFFEDSLLSAEPTSLASASAAQ